MTAIAALAEPPQPGLVPSELTEISPFSKAEAADLYAAMLKGVCTAVRRSGDDLLVNYRAEDEPLDEFAGGHDPEAEVRSVVAGTLGSTNNVRPEPQVSSASSARAGNTVSHLLNEEEEVYLAAVVRPITPLLSRAHLDSTAMRLRSTPVVLDLSAEGRAYFSSFLGPIDFTDAHAEPEVETLARRADDMSHDLGYAPMLPVLETGAGLVTVVPILWSRVEPKQLVPERATTFVFEEGFRVESTDGVLGLVRD